MRSKRGQLGVIEFKFFMMGLLAGLVLGFVAVFLGSKKILPFEIPLMCGFTAPFITSRRGQLYTIEFQYFMIGLGIGLVGALVLVALGSRGILPFQIPLVCS